MSVKNTLTSAVVSAMSNGRRFGGSRYLAIKVMMPIEEWRVFLGISQSTAFVGVTPGLGLRLMLLLLLFRAMGRPLAVWVDAAGGGGRVTVDEVAEAASPSSSSGSGMVAKVGRPLYIDEGDDGEEGEDGAGDLDDLTDLEEEYNLLIPLSDALSSTSTLPSLHVFPPPLPISRGSDVIRPC